MLHLTLLFQTTDVLLFDPRTAACGIFTHKVLQMVPSANWLGSCCYKKTRHTADSYPNLRQNQEHQLLTCLLKFDSPSWSDHQSEDDKLCWNSDVFPVPLATSTKTLRWTDSLYRTRSSLEPHAHKQSSLNKILPTSFLNKVSQSTITQMESCPDVVVGNPVIKSIPISSHFHFWI